MPIIDKLLDHTWRSHDPERRPPERPPFKHRRI